MGSNSTYSDGLPCKMGQEVLTMQQITASEFLARVELGLIKEIFSVSRRVYGTDYTYTLEKAQNGKVCEVVYADVP